MYQFFHPLKVVLPLLKELFSPTRGERTSEAALRGQAKRADGLESGFVMFVCGEKHWEFCWCEHKTDVQKRMKSRTRRGRRIGLIPSSPRNSMLLPLILISLLSIPYSPCHTPPAVAAVAVPVTIYIASN